MKSERIKEKIKWIRKKRMKGIPRLCEEEEEKNRIKTINRM